MLDDETKESLNHYTTIIKVVQVDDNGPYVWWQNYSSIAVAKGAITKKQSGYYNCNSGTHTYYLYKLIAFNSELTWELVEVIKK